MASIRSRLVRLEHRLHGSRSESWLRASCIALDASTAPICRPGVQTAPCDTIEL
jgi:hypothetical protein